MKVGNQSRKQKHKGAEKEADSVKITRLKAGRGADGQSFSCTTADWTLGDREKTHG